MIEVLFLDGCPNAAGLAAHVRALAADHDRAAVVTRRISSDAEARRVRFLGSPTVRVDGVDVEPGAGGRHAFGLMCRVYPTADGLRGWPDDAWIVDALRSRDGVDGNAAIG